MTQIRKWSWLLHIFLILVLGLPYSGWLRNPPLPWFFNPSHSWDVKTINWWISHQKTLGFSWLFIVFRGFSWFFMVFPWFFMVFPHPTDPSLSSPHPRTSSISSGRTMSLVWRSSSGGPGSVLAVGNRFLVAGPWHGFFWGHLDASHHNTLWLFNIAMENIFYKWRFRAGKIIYFYGPCSMAMLNDQRIRIIRIIIMIWHDGIFNEMF